MALVYPIMPSEKCPLTRREQLDMMMALNIYYVNS